MGLLQNAKVAMGVGAAELEIALAQPEHFRGGAVTGYLQVRGGEIAQMATLIEISTHETWSETRYRNGKSRTVTKEKSYGRVALATNFSVPAGGAFQWPFKIPIPRGANLGHSWSVQASISVPGAVDRHASVALQPYDSAAMLGLKQALCQIAPFSLRGVSHQHFDLAPPPDLEAALDGVKFLGIEADGGDFLVGQLEINPQEKSLGDRFKSLIHGDRIQFPIQIPRAALQPNRAPAPEVVTNLRSVLAPYLSEAPNASTTNNSSNSSSNSSGLSSSGLFETVG